MLIFGGKSVRWSQTPPPGVGCVAFINVDNCERPFSIVTFDTFSGPSFDTFSVDLTHLAEFTYLALIFFYTFSGVDTFSGATNAFLVRNHLCYNCLDGNLVLSGQPSVFFHALPDGETNEHLYTPRNYFCLVLNFWSLSASCASIMQQPLRENILLI